MELIRRNTGYGLRALLHMATNSERESFNAEELAEAAETTLEFMHKILQALIAAAHVRIQRQGSLPHWLLGPINEDGV